MRRAHLENFERLVRAGVIVFGGALGDVESAFIVVRVPASMLVLPVIALRFVNPAQLVTRSGRRAADGTSSRDPGTPCTPLRRRRCASRPGMPPVFAHGDLAPVNVLVDHGRVVAVVDFERARMAHPPFEATWLRCGPADYRATRTLPPRMAASTSASVAIDVSPGVVMARAPCAAPYSTARAGPWPVRNP